MHNSEIGCETLTRSFIIWNKADLCKRACGDIVIILLLLVIVAAICFFFGFHLIVLGMFLKHKPQQGSTRDHLMLYKDNKQMICKGLQLLLQCKNISEDQSELGKNTVAI